MIEIIYSVSQQDNKLKIEYDFCTFGFDIYLETVFLENIQAQNHNNDSCSENYKILTFGIYNDYYIFKPMKLPEFYYYHNSTFVKSNTPFLSRYYFKLSSNTNLRTLTVELFENQKSGDICRFQYLDVSRSNSNTEKCTRECTSDQNCFYNPCDIFTFKNIPNNVKIVKIQVLKNEMELSDYNSGIYVCKHFIKFELIL